MHLTPPGGPLTFLSLLWLVYSAICLWLGIRLASPTFLIFAAVIGLPTIGIWLQSRAAGWVLLGVFVLSIPLGLFALVVLDDNWSSRAVRLIQLPATCYFAFLLYRWSNS